MRPLTEFVDSFSAVSQISDEVTSWLVSYPCFGLPKVLPCHHALSCLPATAMRCLSAGCGSTMQPGG